MTVLTDAGRTQIITTEGQTILEIGFDITSSGNISPALATEQLRVVKWDGETQTDLQYGIDLDYLLSDDLQDVVLNNPAVAGDIYTILLDPPRTQGITYPQGSFSPLTQEAIADQNARMSISLDYRLRRVPTLIATFSGQIPFNPVGNARKVIGIADSEESFALFNIIDLFPPLVGDAGRIPQLAEDGWLEPSPLINVDGTVVCEGAFETPTIKIGSTSFFSNTIGSIDFQLNGPGNVVGLERAGDQIFLIPREGGGGGSDIDLDPGQIGYAIYYGGENLLRTMPTLAFLDNRTIVSDHLNENTLALYNNTGVSPNLEFIKFNNVSIHTFFTAESNAAQHQVAFDLDPDNISDGHFLVLYRETVTIGGIVYPRIAIRESEEDPRGNVSLSPRTPNPQAGQIGVWEGHDADDNVKFMYAGGLKITNNLANELPTFEGGEISKPVLRSFAFTFFQEGAVGGMININLMQGLVHYVLLDNPTIMINFVYDATPPTVIQGVLLLEKVLPQGQSINVTWPANSLWPQGAVPTVLSGPEDSVFEFYFTIMNDGTTIQTLFSPGVQKAIIDNTTVQSIAQDTLPNQITKYIGVTGKFIVNDPQALIGDDATFINWDWAQLQRIYHERLTETVAIVSGILELDLDAAMVFNIDLNQDITQINLLNITPGAKQLRLSNTTDRSIAWPDYFLFKDGIPPPLAGTSFIQLFVVTRPEVKVFVTADIINLQDILILN